MSNESNPVAAVSEDLSNGGQGTTPAPKISVSKDTRRRVVTASFIGNFVEWFDYAVYGYLAGIISTVFFPESDRQTALLATFGVFAISFFVRPIGGFIWGHIGDRIGRKQALSLSILLMSVATFCIALIPGYATIGVMAPILLLLVRVVQGFSAAGEYAGASAFLVEYAPAHRRGLYAAVVPASTAAGLLLGSLLAALLTSVMSAEQLNEWGWRLPFLLAAPMGLIGRYIRTKLEDTPAFRELAETDHAVKAPAFAMFRTYRKQLVIATGAVLLNAVGFYVILSYMPTYLSEELGFGAAESFLATTIALASYIGFIFLTGIASDRFGRKKMLIIAAVLFSVLTVPAFMLLDSGSFAVIVFVQILLGGMLTLNDGTLPSFLAELFPTKVRYTGFAVSFNLSNALFGGTAPFMATLLIGMTHNQLAPGWYLVAASLVSLIAVLFAAETSRKPLQQD
ncbi:MFS transporter [Arthrobacter sp. TES]|jgi:MFS transporter, MHS family, proline/betaine transporter|uniref:MFS transporter n=1 Tax=Paenarthrobacter TaxID=1742992 RepID=UPI000396B60B|nr:MULTISPECIES: MFS transporter [Paenarthrobacter]AMB41911.1 MFS transporter [Arthrobacter sp. ATCC 21022]AOY73770.1 MFS transporter [Arthrobacter sp. ZXY-2]ERI36103.1 MFS transporter [Arthrobacter sp. AK-YN10]QOI61898.1 MFS transporter [Arthrobacter sp. TES]BCW85936.1 proline/betaine transporter [Arthrobacter sp. NicSoilE8]